MKKKQIGFRSTLCILTIVAVLILNNSCKHDGVPADQFEQIKFSEQVLPIFQNSCATSGCHDGRGGESDYIFTDYSGIMKSITPGNADKSEAYQAMISTFELMPPKNALSVNKRTVIRLWIEQGAKMN